MSHVGTKIGHIRIVEALGKGGMGEVYVGFDETLERKVAVKAIRSESRLSSEARARFLREARILSQLRHPNICQIHDYVERKENDFLVLELIEGRSLNAALGEGLDKPRKLRIAEQLARVLVAAHEKDIVHRDLKPSNIMLTKEGETKVLDFGLARVAAPVSSRRKPTTPPATAAPGAAEDETFDPALTTLTVGKPPGDDLFEILQTRPGAVIGTPAYMSPEQARGEPPTAASDLYSFGLVLQHLFTERPPYPEDLSSLELLDRAAKGQTLPVSGVDPDVAGLIRRLTSLAPGARPSALEVAERLRWSRDKPKRRVRNLLVAAFVAIIVLGGLKYTFDLRRERAVAIAAKDQAEQARDEVQSVVDLLVGLFEVSDPGEARGNSITAREILDRGSRQIPHQLQDRPLTQARMMETIGTVYRKLGLYDEAEPLLRTALATRSGQLDPEHLTVSESLDSLATLNERQGNWEESESLYQDALAIREAELGGEHPDVAEILHGLAFVYLKQGRFEDAEPVYLRALNIREHSFDPEHPDVAATLRDLGILYYSLGRYDEAEDHYQRALAIRRKVLAPDHPDVGHTLNSLASLFLVQGRYEEAEPLYKEALATREKTLGPDHPAVAISLNNLALLYFYQDRFDEVEPLYERSLAIREQALGLEHPDVAESLRNLGLLYSYQARPDEAENAYRRALAVVEASLGGDHPSVASVLNVLGSLCDDQGCLAEAEQMIVRAIAIREKAFGPDHPQLAEVLFNLGYIYHRRLDKFDEAEALYKRALAINRAAFGPDDPDVVVHVEEYAALLRGQGREEEAEALEQRTPATETPPAQE